MYNRRYASLSFHTKPLRYSYSTIDKKTMTAQRFMNRKRLLDAARGLYKPTTTSSSTTVIGTSNGGGTSEKDTTSSTAATTRPLRCFRLQADHVQDMFTASTPDKFHSMLCNKIRHAKQRVYLASLYVGPAACQKAAPKEQELLNAIQDAAQKNNLDIKVLLDKNRALRPVPVSGDVQSTTTSSAEAVYQALKPQPQNDAEKQLSQKKSNQNNNSLFLFSVLPASLQYFLPNPYNEVMGVFHIKMYIIDDSIILSGANLSEEYFVDRYDRYLHITKGGGGLVDFYADLVNVLCDHAETYQGENSGRPRPTPTRSSSMATGASQTKNGRSELIDSLTKVLTSEAKDDDIDESDLNEDPSVVAYAVPTFQAPKGFFDHSSSKPSFLSDTEVTNNLLRSALEEDPTAIIRLSSAYLNPTNTFLRVLSDFEHIDFLTAGRISHGFAPKKKAGNKGKDWIPTVFDTISREACEHLAAAKLLHYSRPGWTFHAKGLWLEQLTQQNNEGHCQLAAVICGSGNYGARSETLDMESNCVLVLPAGSSLEAPLQKEWNDMVQYTHAPPELAKEPQEPILPKGEKEHSEVLKPLSWPLQVCLPIIRKFL